MKEENENDSRDVDDLETSFDHIKSDLTEPSFAELFEADSLKEREKDFFPGDRVKGKVVLITSDTVFIDYGAKSEGWADRDEFIDDQGELTVQPGTSVELTFIGKGPSGAHLGTRLRKSPKEAGLDLIKTAFQAGVSLEGTVTGSNKGGFEITVQGARAFCPFSQIDLFPGDSTETFLGKSYAFKVIKIEEDRNTVVVSRRAVLEAERAALAAKTRETLAVGTVFQGKVVRLTAFGAFVDLGGVEGLLHVSEISHVPVEDPSDLLQVGQVVRVQVQRLEQDEKGNERISLSMKALEPDPWTNGFEFAEGDTLWGRIRRLATFGAFVEIAPGVDGLVHISEISSKRLHHPREALKEGQMVEVKVLAIDPERKRISLSIKEASPADEEAVETIRTGSIIRRRIKKEPDRSPDSEDRRAVAGEFQDREEKQGVKETPSSPRVGLVTRGIVSTLMPYGLFLDLPDLGSRQRGLLHNSELTVERTSHPQKGIREGDELEVEIIKIDAQGRISLSRRSVLTNQDRKLLQEYRSEERSSAKLGTMADLFKKFSNP
jgi:small subunit ribosomal protein S1